jgi:hypothetical protein
MQLLFVLCHWHGLAKLRLHMDETLNILGQVTKDLANHLRRFVSDTCPSFPTKELHCEADVCKRRQEHQNLKAVAAGQSQNGSARRPKGLNLQMYKLHALADYPAHIRVFSTTDSYSTQPVSANLYRDHSDTHGLFRENWNIGQANVALKGQARRCYSSYSFASRLSVFVLTMNSSTVGTILL